MNSSSIAHHAQQARKVFLTAESQAREAEKRAVAARAMTRQARAKLKQTKKLAKLAKKLARKAEDELAGAREALEEAAARLQKAEKKAHKIARQSAPKSAPKQKPRAKAAPAKTVRPAARKKRRTRAARGRNQALEMTGISETPRLNLADGAVDLTAPLEELPVEAGQVN
jgi:hypothetical protein